MSRMRPFNAYARAYVLKNTATWFPHLQLSLRVRLRVHFRPGHRFVPPGDRAEPDDLDLVHGFLPHAPSLPLAVSTASLARPGKGARRGAGVDLLCFFEWRVC